MPEIAQQITETTAQLHGLIEQLSAMIAALPDNPRINRINDKCFIVSFKDLGRNWTPEYHDFRCQYRAIIRAMQRSKSIDALRTLRRIIGAQQVSNESGKGYTKLHPDVIVNLQKLLGVNNG